MAETPIVADPKKPEGPEPGPGSVMYADPSSAPPRAGGESKPVPATAVPPMGTEAATTPTVVFNPSPEEVRFKIVLGAPVEKVFKALIEPAELTKWFCRAATIELKAGGKFAVALVPGKTADWEIKALVPNKSLDLVRPETLSFALAAEPDGRTKLQVNVQLHNDESQSVNEQILWSVHLVYLKAWLENGVDLREKDLTMTWKNGFVNGLEPG